MTVIPADLLLEKIYLKFPARHFVKCTGKLCAMLREATARARGPKVILSRE